MSLYLKKILMFLVMSIPAVLFGQTYFSGTLYQDTTMYLEDSPYIITDNVIIPQEYKLTIEPGVELQFEHEFSIKVYGEIYAVGDVHNRISFSSSNIQANWLGVSVLTEHGFDYPEKSVLFKSCDFSNADIVLSVAGRNNIEVSDCNIENCFSGIRVLSSDSTVIRNNTLKNGDYGIYLSSLKGTYNLVQNNDISGYSQVGVFIFGDVNGDFQNARIINNRISNCNNGIYVTGGDNMCEQIIVGNYLYNNNDGVKVHFSERNYISKNTFDGNNNALELNRSVGNNIINNIMIENGLAVMLKASRQNNVSGNTFLRNEIGIELSRRDANNVSEENNVNRNIFDNSSEKAIIVNKGCQGVFDENDILNDGDDVVFQNNSSRDQSAENCYWGTYNGSVIEQKVYHRLDDSELGFVDYSPFVFHSSVDGIDAPQNITKQLVGDTVILRWLKSENPLVTNYRVYYEDMGMYMFSDTIITVDCEIKLLGYDILKDIYVTACDDEADGYYDQHEMHESWFGEAVLIPFAGYDFNLCEGDVVEMLSATAFEYDSIHWITNGKGVFSEEDVVNTIYLPDDDDINNSNLFAVLHQYNGEYEYYDSVKIFISPSPEADAGRDEFILYDSVLRLINANAAFYDSIRWNTLGDGCFSDSSVIDPIYFPGDYDRENTRVKLFLQAFSGCGYVCDTMQLDIQSTYSITGKIHGIGEQGKALLYLINKDSSYKAQSLVSVIDKEAFKIMNVIKGNYYLYVIPRRGMHDYFPTYYVNKIFWQDAYMLNVKEDVYDIDIDLVEQKYSLPIGQCEINGVVTTSEDDMILHNPVFLCDTNGVLLNWTTTDSYGEFYLKDLPYGFYRVMYEKAGYPVAYSSVIHLTKKDNIYNNISVVKKNNRVNISLGVADKGKVMFFPTICSGILNVNFENSAENIYISILNIGGNEVARWGIKKVHDQSIRQLNISHLSAGVYFVRVFSGDEMLAIQKIVLTGK